MRQFLNLLGSVVALSLIFLPLEFLAPAERGQPFGKRLFNLAYYPFLLACGLFLLQPISNLLAGRVLMMTGGGFLPLAPQRGFVEKLLFAVLFAFIWDVWQYWVHRLQHLLPFLWQTHRFHHTDTAVNSTTQARHHFASNALSAVLYLPVLALFGPMTPHFVAAFLLFRVWGFINHMNVRLDIGPLTPIIAGPQWHRIHHSVQVNHMDKNFATFFPMIDVFFGTYYKPRKHEFPKTGLADGSDMGSFKEATISPFVGWYNGLAKGLLSLRKKKASRRRLPYGSAR